MKQLSEEKQMMVFDLLEGNLDSASAQKVEAMIAGDPAMAREYRLMQKTYLVPEPIVFAGKDAIKQPALEMQLLVFDLLEGNLDEPERERVLAMIDKDPALKKEFKQMQQAYLTQEPVLYEDKESLKKKGGGIFYMNTYRSAIAAGMLLLISGLGYVTWRMAGEDGAKDNSAPIAIGTDDNETPPVATLPQDVERVAGNTGAATFAHAQKTTRVVSMDGFEPNAWTGASAPLWLDRQVAMSAAADMQPPVVVEEGTEISYVYQDNSAFQAPVSYERRRSLGHRLMHSTRRMLAQLKTPEIGISFKNTGHLLPKVQMSYKTDKEEVIATLID